MALRDQGEKRIPGRLSRALVPHHHLELRAAQARGDLEIVEPGDRARSAPQRRGDLGLRDAEQPEHVLLVVDRARHGVAERLCGHRGGPHLVQLARRPGQHHDRRARAVQRRHHEPRRRAGRLDHRRPLRHDGLLAVRRPHGVRIEVAPAPHERLEDVRDAALESGVKPHRTPGEAGHDLGRQVVSGRTEPAARHDQVHTLVGHEAQLRLHVLGTVAADRDVREVDAELGEPVGQPGAVPVAHPAREDLRAGHHDSRPGAHPIVPAPTVPAPVPGELEAQALWPKGSTLARFGVSW